LRNGKRIGVVIPALNEEEAIEKVVAEIPAWVDAIVVADNGSSDRTSAVAKATGALVVREEVRGYGAACQAGLAALPASDIIVFLDGDYSDYPDDMHLLVDPIATGEVDLMIGSRVLGEAQSGALTPPQVFGNWLATRLIHLIWGTRFTDLGPFRAIRAVCLQRLHMTDRDYGWTVEMQIKAAKSGFHCAEVPVRYRRRVGISKISGTIQGSLKAGMKILAVICRHAIWQERASSMSSN
jgi:glycosyltransferase involved in cell wall biosynthesis